MVNQLPQGWKEVPFNSIFDVCNSGKEKIKQSEYLPKADGLLPVVDQGQNLVSGYSNQFQKVILAKDNPLIVFGDHTRCVKYIDFDFVVGADGTQLIRTKENTLVKLGYYQLMSANIPNNGYSRHFKYVKEQAYKLIIDKDEQKYIVDTLDAVAEIIRLRKENIQLTKDLIPTIFHEMFGDPERKICLADVATIKGGKRLPYGGQLQDETTVHPYIRIADMVNNTIKKDELKYISDVIYNKIQNYTISSRDVYISIAGTIGRVGLVPDNLEGANLTENAAKIVLNENKINKVFLVYELLTDVLQSQIKSLTVQAGVPKLAISRIESLKIYCPPLSEQEKFADKVEQINKYIAAQQEELEQFETLFQSLLQEAFTGILTWKYPRKESND
jgi:type I restriction enzyme S subunit